MTRPAIICDLDGTLCDIDHRIKYIDGSLGKKDWDKFYTELFNDKANEWCRTIIDMVSQASWDNLSFLFVTGRPEKYRDLTEVWFNKKENKYLFDPKIDLLFMRATDDLRPDHIIKQEIYLNHIKDEYDVLFCLEDRQRVVDMWRSLDLICLQCARGQF